MSANKSVTLSGDDIEIRAIRAQGPGGQNVNKVSSAVQLRFNIKTSSLSDFCKNRLLQLKDRRISSEGIIIIKAQRYRSQDKNKEDAVNRLRRLVEKASVVNKKRIPTKATASSKKKRLDCKSRQSRLKQTRSKVRYGDD